MSILNVKDSARLEVLRLLEPEDPAYFAILNRPHEDLEQRTKDLDRIFTPARGLRVRQTSPVSASVEVETGIILDTNGVTIESANSGAVQTIGPVPAAAAGMIRADLIYFNLLTKTAVRLAGSEVAVGSGFSDSLWPDLPVGLAGAVPLGILYVGENIGGSVDFDETITGDSEGQILDVRPAPGVLKHLFETNPANLATDVTSGAVGTLVTVVRADHRHPLNVDGTIPTTMGAGLAASVGAAATYSRRDHRHAITIEANAGVMLQDGTASAGSTAEIARADHRHPLNVDAVVPSLDTAGGAIGGASTYSRRDHRHPLQVTGGNPADLVGGGAATPGVSPFYSRHDHVHAMTGVMVGRAIFGQVTSAGAIGKAGSADWTSSRVGLGFFRVTFSVALASTNYSVVATTQENAPATMRTIKILDMATTHFDIFVGTTGGAATDDNFNFQVML